MMSQVKRIPRLASGSCFYDDRHISPAHKKRIYVEFSKWVKERETEREKKFWADDEKEWKFLLSCGWVERERGARMCIQMDQHVNDLQPRSKKEEEEEEEGN
jgi:hypothetical protein